MSDLKTQAKQFKRHWADCVWLEKEEGQTDEQIKLFEDEIRENWYDDEYRISVCTWAKQRSEFRQELIEMARKVFSKCGT